MCHSTVCFTNIQYQGNENHENHEKARKRKARRNRDPRHACLLKLKKG